MDLLLKATPLLIGGLIIWFVWRASRPPRVFDIRVAGGEPRVVTGTVTAAFLRRVRELAAEHGIATARVWGVRADPPAPTPRSGRGGAGGGGQGGRVRLLFSADFPAPACQQLRNWWAASGWPAGK